MKLILRQAALTGGIFAAMWSVLLAITFLVQPDPPRDGWMDIWTAGQTLYLTSPKYAFLGRDALDTPEPKVLLLGASNTGYGLKQAQVQALTHCAKVSNLAMGNANVSEMRQMIDLVHEVQDDAARRSDNYVFGVWFGMFVDTEQRWPGADRSRGDTDLDIERYRYGFYRRTKQGPEAVLPPAWLRTGVVLIRPYLMLEEVARDLTAGLRSHLFAHQPDLTDADRERMAVSEQEKRDTLEYWRRTMGGAPTISERQVQLLQDTIEGLLQSGAKVVLADLPIPAWHHDASPYEPAYETAIRGVFDHFAGRPGFAALRMPDLTADDDFSDEVHPKPHVARIWAARLGAALDPLLCSASS